MNASKKLTKLLATMVLMAFLGTSFTGMVTAAVEDNPINNVTHETGTTTELGGGDYVLIRFNKDAAFGIIYGTDKDPNGIVLVSMHVRYLGVAEVQDQNGASIGQTVPIPVLTVFAMKLEDMFEFNDTNDDGICNYRRWGFGLTYNQYYVHEPIYKRVSLETGWVRSDIDVKTDDADKSKDWTFSLTAKNLPYTAVGDSQSIRDDVANEKLDKVEFTFHLSAQLKEYNNISVPTYKVTVQKQSGQGGGPGGSGGQNQYTIMKSERVQNRLFSGMHANYEVKFDHLIEGWDFDPTNDDPHLLLEWHALVGNLIPNKVAEWINAEFTNNIDSGSNATVETESGATQYSEQNANDGTPFLESPKRVKTAHIQCGADWAKVGKLTWVSDVMVDGTADKMYAQVQGGLKISIPTAKGQYHGFALLAGFSYPGGQKVFHDPGISNSMPVSIELGTKDRNLKGIVLVVGIVAVVGLIAVVGVSYSMKKKGKEDRNYYNGSYDVASREEKGSKDWDEYYRK